MPYVVIIGGGQGGIALGARMKRLGVPALILERNARAGDSWRKRYKSLCLHDPVWYDHLPYLPFPDDRPVFAAKDKVGDWLEMYTKVMELNYWHSTEALSARFDDATQEWVVEALREGRPVTLRPKQLVFALGVSGFPNVPSFPGADTFEGEQHHSSQHPGGEAYRGRKAVVLGSNNSAHDICAALWEHGADVTIVQRSSTHIAPSESLMELALGGLYSEQAVKNGIDHHKADLIFASVPYRIMHSVHIPVYDEMKKRDADLYARLEKAGFQLDFGDDGSGLFMKYLRRGSGYYIDVGASELVADGRIKLASGNIETIKPNSVVLTSGQELPADLIVYATGYGSMNGWIAKIVSPEVADRVGKCWGLGSATTKDPGPWEGELRNMWKPTQQPQLWIHGGNLHQSTPLLAVPGAAAEGAHGRHPDAGVRAGAGAPPAQRRGTGPGTGAARLCSPRPHCFPRPMAEPLKHQFGPPVVQRIAAMLAGTWPAFDAAAFTTTALEGLEALELMPRARHVAQAMHRYLPDDFAQASTILHDSFGPPLAATAANGMAPFLYLPHGMVVAEHGLDHFELSMRVLHALTQRFTAEWAIRPFLDRQPEPTLARLAQWADDPSEHVRRLVSEGTRPRLPWAPRLRAFQRDPAHGLALLERLKDDPSPYVRRSVANHLNDIGKDHPAVLVETARRWLADATPQRRWIVGHALRHAVKQGDAGALMLLGYGEASTLVVREAVVAPSPVTIGGRLQIGVTLANPTRRAQEVLVDLQVGYMKASGQPAPKVFKWTRLALAPGESVALSRTLSLADLTTRRHHPGRHTVALLLNGQAVPLGDFELRA